MRRVARRLVERIRDLLQTALRLVPWPTEPGLRRVGAPGASSPVIVTGNYDLTVRRVLRALRDLDAWVVVAPSQGINVWCAASGGILTSHQVVTALKTSGIEDLVRHRRAIVPPLAATGVMPREVSRRCGWKLRFGPVYAEDLPRYLERREQKSDDMRQVHFGVRERLEMAAAWAVPAGLLLGLPTAWLRPAWSLPLVGLAVAAAVAVFLVFDRIPGPRRIIFGGVVVTVTLGLVALSGGGAAALVTAGVASAALTAVLTFDYSGSTPIAAGSHFEERRWQVVLDSERCDGIYSCWEVCPRACYEKAEERRKIVVAHGERCIRCGACVVQCPADALAFTDEAGNRIEPDVIRRFKLNLMGRREVDAGPDGSPPSVAASP